MYLMSLIFSILFLLLLNIFAFKKDLISPSVVVCAVFFISSLCSAYNYKYWGFKIHENTYLTIVYGLLLFSVVSFLTEIILHECKIKSNIKPVNELKIINISRIKIYIFIGLCVLFSMWYAFEIIRVARRYGFVSSLSDITGIYRSVSSYGFLSVEDDINFMCKQLYKFVPAMSYVTLYVFFNNSIVMGKFKDNIIFLIPSIVYFLFSLISGGRYQIIRVVSAAIFMYYILYMKNSNWRSNIRLSFIFKCMCVLLCFCVFFVLTRELVGRKADKDPVYYITFYAGGSIPLFDSFLQYPPTKSTIWGKETFYSINSFIGRYFDIPELQYITHHEFRLAPTGKSMGNVYTVFRRMIYDFGYVGMTILYSVCAFIYTFLYNKIKFKRINPNIDLGIIFYSYISFGLTMQFYEEAFFTSIMSIGTIVTFLMIYFCKVFLINVSLKKDIIKSQKNLYKKRYNS